MLIVSMANQQWISDSVCRHTGICSRGECFKKISLQFTAYIHTYSYIVFVLWAFWYCIETLEFMPGFILPLSLNWNRCYLKRLVSETQTLCYPLLTGIHTDPLIVICSSPFSSMR